MIIRAFQSNSPLGPWADNGTVSCSRFIQTPASPDVCPSRILAIDAGGAAGWTVRDSRFENLACASGVHRTIAFDDGSRDTKIINNTFINVAMNIRLGNDPPTSRTYADTPPAASGPN